MNEYLNGARKMKRENPRLLPICQYCGKYKGIGQCTNPKCQSSEKHMDKQEQVSLESSARDHEYQHCSICERDIEVICNQCGRGYCNLHSVGFNLNRLENFHQRVGTCIQCQQVVCERCWILNPNGDIICLTHLEKEHESAGFH